MDGQNLRLVEFKSELSVKSLNLKKISLWLIGFSFLHQKNRDLNIYIEREIGLLLLLTKRLEILYFLCTLRVTLEIHACYTYNVFIPRF